MENMAIVLFVPQLAQIAVWIDKLIQEGRGLPSRFFSPELAEEVDGDAAQPGAERPWPAIVFELRQPANQHFQDALAQIVAVGLLQPCRPQPFLQKRLIDGDQPLPGLLGIMAWRFANLIQKAERGFGRGNGHGASVPRAIIPDLADFSGGHGNGSWEIRQEPLSCNDVGVAVRAGSVSDGAFLPRR